MSGPGEARGRAFARAALLGNPSDGFGGKTLGVIVPDFAAEVTIRPATAEPRTEKADDAPALTRAALERFDREFGAAAGRRDGLTIALETDIPREVGLGGSSAIVIATLRALCELCAVEIDPGRLAALALAVEVEELGIAAGPQDRVIQAYEGLVYMDFGSAVEEPYEVLDPALLPELFVAYRTGASRPSGEAHAVLRRRHARGDEGVVEALDRIAKLAESGRRCVLDGDRDGLGRLMLANVAARSALMELDPRHLRMVEIARSLEAPANYAGSGGAIVGLAPPPERRNELREAFAAEGCKLLFPGWV